MKEKIKIQKGFIQIPLLIAIIVSIVVISAGGYGGFEYYKTSKVIREAKQLTGEEKYDEAIEKLEFVKTKLLAKTILKQKINIALDTNKKLLEDKSKYSQGIEEFNKGNWEKAKELLLKVSEISPHYQEAKRKIEEAQRKITEKQIAEVGKEVEEEAQRKIAEEEAKRKAAGAQLKLKRELTQKQISELKFIRLEAAERWAVVETKRWIEENVHRRGSLLQDFYNEVRNEYMPRVDLSSLLLDPQRNVEFAAELAKHALGNNNWPIQDAKYYSLAGRHSYEDAKFQLDTIVIELFDLWPGEIYPSNDYGKVQYILDFVQYYIHYEHDMNEIFRAPAETLGLRSGDCDDWSILVSAFLADAGIPSAIMFVANKDRTEVHAMVLFQSEEIFPGLYYYDDLTSYGLPSREWYILEPQYTFEEHQQNPDWFKKWDIVAAALVEKK